MRKDTTTCLSAFLFILDFKICKLNASKLDLIISSDVGLDGLLKEYPSKENEVMNRVENANISCRVYVAPSSIPGAGIGIFAGDDFQKGDIVTPADSIIPIVDLAWNNFVNSFENDFLWGMSILECY